jgi:hypothetical protein
MRRRTEPLPEAREGTTGEPGWSEHRRWQVRRGLLLTPAERLHWLVDASATFARWQGRARPRG